MRPHVDLVLAGEYAPPAHIELSGIQRVLDIGANVGAFTAWAHFHFPQARITAVEPMPDNAWIFAENTVDFHPRVELVRAAAWPMCNGGSRLLMQPGRQNCGEATMFLREDQLNEKGLGIAVDAIHPRHLPAADFIKLDTEGAELDILKHLDLSAARVIALEWHRAADRVAIKEFLEEHGRRFLCVTDRETHPGSRGILIFAERRIIGKKLFIGLPVYGGYHAHFIAPLLQLTMQPPVPLTVRQRAGDSLVSRARNTIAAEFLLSDCTHLLFLDTDLIFTPEQIARLASHDEPIVAGFYPKKQKELDWVVNLLPGETPDHRGLQKIKYAGTGCLMIAREVLEQMIEAHPEIAFKDDAPPHATQHDFFSVGVYKYPDGSRRYLSEDWYFCQRALDLGIPILADTRVALKHCGEIIFPLEDPWEEVPAAGH